MKWHRLRLRSSVRGLMFAVLIFGALLGWKARRASVQRGAVAEIKWAGGWVSYE